ncbi:MAG TPA: isoprenylcysteine carboxylmethyltransferase family protein [Halothiobacillaceae bacterium]|nr:isoprenylcysteine carboxylmethyltransferase family protein [Halothiobacillaceae bacterium]
MPVGQISIPGQSSSGLMLFLIGLLIMLSAAFSMSRAQTTINPLTPERSKNLVTHGIFKRTRNPIYLADAIILIGMVFWFGQLLGILVVAAFIWYTNRVQIPTEERILSTLFGESYQTYCQNVPRWL